MSCLDWMTEYDVFPETGFLPDKFPLTRLPQEYYQPWETIITNLPSLILMRRLRRVVDDQLDRLSTEFLSDEREFRRAYQVLSFIAHGYIWEMTEVTDRLPRQIAEPLVEVAERLGVPPLATYASLCLWNFQPILPNDCDGDKVSDDLDLDNITTINTFTGSIDESWFYLVSIWFEKRGAEAIRVGLEAMDSALRGDNGKLVENLQRLAEVIDSLGSVMMRMEEMCDPHTFYFRLRPFLAGWKNMADAGLTKGGVFYGDEQVPRSYSGGSNGQSSIIQFFDLLLGINHWPTGERPAPHQNKSFSPSKETKETNFMDDMKQYMPRKHRQFLLEVQQRLNIREYVLSVGKSNPELILSYDACLAMIKLFRDKHIQIVTRYIVLQAKYSAKLGSLSTVRSGLAKQKNHSATEMGTGGTALLPFLKQCRDETGDPAAGKWGKRILSDGVMRLRYSKPNGINED